MASSSVMCNPRDAVRKTGATDVLVYRRAGAGRFVLTSPAETLGHEELMTAEEPVIAAALRLGVRRVASEVPRELCAGYVGRAAAVVAVDVDVVVILGRRDGCLAGVADDDLVAAARASAIEAAVA